MANGSMEVEYAPRSIIQGIPSTIRIQERHYGVPVIKITHVFEERLNAKSRKENSTSAKSATLKTKEKKRGTCEQCNSNTNQTVPCADNCLSLMLPLEVELNVLGIVDQGMIDRGEMAKVRRVVSRKRNSAPDISVETLPVEPQRSRPRSYHSTSDLKTLLNRQSLQSTILCSTEL